MLDDRQEGNRDDLPAPVAAAAERLWATVGEEVRAVTEAAKSTAASIERDARSTQRDAEDEAQRIVAHAEKEAAEIRDRAAGEAERIRQEATHSAATVLASVAVVRNGLRELIGGLETEGNRLMAELPQPTAIAGELGRGSPERAYTVEADELAELVESSAQLAQSTERGSASLDPNIARRRSLLAQMAFPSPQEAERFLAVAQPKDFDLLEQWYGDKVTEALAEAVSGRGSGLRGRLRLRRLNKARSG